MNAEDFVDTESIREAMDGKSFAALESRLRDKLSAQIYFARQRRLRMAAVYHRLSLQANERLGGWRPQFNMDHMMYVWLNQNEPGWETDPAFVKSLFKYHPECEVKVQKAPNKVGWTPSLNRSGKVEKRHTLDISSKPPVNKLVLTDERGNSV